MRRQLSTSLRIAAALAAASSCGRPTPTGENNPPIAYGTLDNSHTAVVALLADSGGGSFTECSGSIVQIKSGVGYVLTAAHCCNMGAPQLVVVSNDYSVGEQYLGSSNPQPPVYPVVSNSVWYDSRYAGNGDYDFCMLQFSGATSSMATLKLPTSSSDGLSLGTSVEHVGFGVTQSSSSNTRRYTGTDTVDQQLTSTVAACSQGGGTAGPCEGDSGGPALIPAGVSQSSQTIVATTSYGNSSSCSSNSLSVSARVSSEIGSGKFITSYLNDAPTGTQVGSAMANCSTCAQSSESGTCKTQATACANDSACTTLSTCLNNCTTQQCATQCENTAGSTAVSELNAFDSCVCNTACPTECATECASSGTPDGGTTGGGCGFTTGDATCDSCLTNSCCSSEQACANDTTCTSCVTSTNPPSSCNSNSLVNAFLNCFSSSCNTQCGGSSGGPDGGGVTPSDASVGPGPGPDFSTSGLSDGGTGGNADFAHRRFGSSTSGCSVAAGGASSSPSSLLAVLALVGLALVRRRRR